jgi:hypothetical protein
MECKCVKVVTSDQWEEIWGEVQVNTVAVTLSDLTIDAALLAWQGGVQGVGIMTHTSSLYFSP